METFPSIEGSLVKLKIEASDKELLIYELEPHRDYGIRFVSGNGISRQRNKKKVHEAFLGSAMSVRYG